MKVVHIRPSYFLSNYIAGYATVSIDNKYDFPYNGSALPDGYVEIYFSKYGSLSLKSEGRYDIEHLHTGFIIGQSNKRIEVFPNESLEFFQIKVFPWAAKYFLNEKGISYSNKAIFISEFNNPKLNKLQEEILNAKTTEERIQVVELFTLNSIKENKEYPKLLYKSCNYIFNSKGTLHIKNLANSLNISTQYLERLFKDYIGLSPKQFAKVIRIRSLVSFQKTHPNVPLTTLGYKFNYFDQAHFIHDFKAFMDETPKIFFKKNDNFVFDYSPFGNTLIN